MCPRCLFAPLIATVLLIIPAAQAQTQPPPPPPGQGQNPAPLRNDPKRPVGRISADLGITPDQFVACFNNVNPVGAGQRTTTKRVHANKAVLLPCLQKANPDITNDSLDRVMDRYRPGGREAQRPMDGTGRQ
ncbi:hypothetical protein [Rhodospirillum sp. A1_3_36]|uniref:hypothetical protein n=1 Tax=Rhodospirillum sp. A1_3_36 TaxID=3391666 RepID=UPI0039A4FA42